MGHNRHLGRSDFALFFKLVINIPDFDGVVSTATDEEFNFSWSEANILNAFSMTLKGG
jgi:hypothetical protein